MPAGPSRWLHERSSIPGTRCYPVTHRTAALAPDITEAAPTVAVPETPLTESIPLTGFPVPVVGISGGVFVVSAAGLLVERRRRRASRQAGRPRNP